MVNCLVVDCSVSGQLLENCGRRFSVGIMLHATATLMIKRVAYNVGQMTYYRSSTKLTMLILHGTSAFRQWTCKQTVSVSLSSTSSQPPPPCNSTINGQLVPASHLLTICHSVINVTMFVRCRPHPLWDVASHSASIRWRNYALSLHCGQSRPVLAIVEYCFEFIRGDFATYKLQA